MSHKPAKIGSGTFANPSRILRISDATPCKVRTYPRRHSFTSPVFCARATLESTTVENTHFWRPGRKFFYHPQHLCGPSRPGMSGASGASGASGRLA
eukprot:4674412-Prymnesium_polylepis.1